MLSPVMSSRGLTGRGIAALILGIVALLLPGPAFVGLSLVLGGYLFANGIFALASAFTKEVEGHGWLFLEAAVCILLGIAMFVRPLFTAFGLTFLLGLWAILAGALQIGEAFVLRRYIQREGLYLLGGVLTLLLGLVILSRPFTGALKVTALLGIYGIMFGVFSLAAAWHVHVLEESPAETKPRRAA
jgi:uncharacterized membrane protein HdeD (DUF308 family)